jgi:NAD-dependent histone deacetylase SIR2
MVQEPVPAPNVVDLPVSSDPVVGESAYGEMKAGATAAVEQKRDEADDEDEWENTSLYEEILDEVEAFEYSTDGKP